MANCSVQACHHRHWLDIYIFFSVVVLLLCYPFFFYYEKLSCKISSYIGTTFFSIENADCFFVFLNLYWKFIILLVHILCHERSWTVITSAGFVTHRANLPPLLRCHILVFNALDVLQLFRHRFELCVRFELLMAVNINTALFRHVTPCCLAGRCECFG